MADETVEIGESDKKNSKNCLNLKINGSILESFWKMSDLNDEKRKKAIINFISLMEIEQQNAQAKSTSSNPLSYCLERLVKGLASGNKAARLGFYVALVETLRGSCVAKESVGHVLKLAKEHLISSNGKSDTSDAAIGLAMAYGALIRSRCIFQDTKSAKHICEELFRLSEEREFLREMCTTLFVEFLAMVDSLTFRKEIWPAMQKHVCDGWNTCSAEVLWILLVLTQQHPKAVNGKFLSKHWGGACLLDLQTFKDQFISVMMKSTKSHPRIHPVCKELLNLKFHSDDFPEFWKSLITVCLAKQQKEKGYLVYELVKESLKLVKSPVELRWLLSPFLLQNVMHNLAHKIAFLYEAALQLCKSLTVFFTEMEEDFQYEMIIILTITSGSIVFDQVTQTGTIGLMRNQMKKNVVVRYAELLKRVFNGSYCSDEITIATSLESETSRSSIFSQLSKLVKLQCVKDDVEFQSDILKFLLFHAFFRQLRKSDEVPLCSSDPVAVSVYLNDRAADCFSGSLSFVPKRSASSQQGSAHVKKHLHVLKNVLTFAIHLLKSGEVVKQIKPFPEHVSSLLKDVLKTVKSHQKLNGMSDEMTSASEAFQILFLHLGLRLFFEVEQTPKKLEELHVCAEKALQIAQTRNSVTDDEPEWIEVVVDLLLDLLSENSQHLRSVSISVMSLYVDHLTPAAVDLILDVINPVKDQEDPIMEEADEDNGSSSGDSVSEEEKEVEENESLNGDVNPELRNTIENALGSAVATSENEDEGDLDDDEMMQMDDALSEAFRAVAKKKTAAIKEEESLLHFRNRCVNFLDAIVLSRPTVQFLSRLVLPLISTCEFAVRESNQESLYVRASTCLRRVINVKKFCDEGNTGDWNLDLEEILRELFRKFDTISDFQLLKLLAESCVFVYKCARHVEQTGNVEETSSIAGNCVEIYQEALTDFFQKKDCHITPDVFYLLITKYFDAGWSLAKLLLKFSFTKETRPFKQSQGLDMLVQLVSHSNRIGQVVASDKLGKFFARCVTKCAKVLKEACDTPLKPRLLTNLLNFTSTVLTCRSKRELSQQNEDDNLLREAAEKLKQLSGLTKDTKRELSRICAILKINDTNGKSPKKSNKKKRERTTGEKLTNYKKLKTSS